MTMDTVCSGDLTAIAQQFSPHPVKTVRPLGNGLINDTFLVNTSQGRLVLQRVNRHVFADPALITANLAVLAAHWRRQQPALLLPEPLPTQDGALYHLDASGGFWRGQRYIADTISVERLANADHAAAVGFALGRFHGALHDLNPGHLHDTLPGFHITPAYLGQYRQVASRTGDGDRFCADFIDGLAAAACELEQAKRQGLLPVRVIHGDPKLDNFLFDPAASKVVALVDLDTVKPGLVHYDIGDCLRSCCHRPSDDTFDLEVCARLLAAYLSQVRHFFTAGDYDYLYPAMRLIPFELGLRFYTDHLQGDRYFKVDAPGQNLARARQQFRLCASVIAQESAIKALLARLVAGQGAGH